MQPLRGTRKNEDELEKVRELKYLGLTISKGGEMEGKVSYRLSEAAKMVVG